MGRGVPTQPTSCVHERAVCVEHDRQVEGSFTCGPDPFSVQAGSVARSVPFEHSDLETDRLGRQVVIASALELRRYNRVTVGPHPYSGEDARCNDGSNKKKLLSARWPSSRLSGRHVFTRAELSLNSRRKKSNSRSRSVLKRLFAHIRTGWESRQQLN